ncbi:MAG: hypothetical protein NE327_15185 [Lentisphaeraceae bacterium]|nr:hypothetical protein [Lentisphaeraceae bacterium]
MNVKLIATLLKLAVILAVIGFAGMQCFSSGYSHYENQAASGLPIPENATDINVYNAITTWYCYDFKTDFESYKKWVANYKEETLSQISLSTERMSRYNKKQDKILFHDNIEHYRASWTGEGRGVYLMYIPKEGRAYFASHSR